jgi:hypothetical protein
VAGHRSIAIRADRHERQSQRPEADAERDERGSGNIQDGRHETADPDRDRERGQAGAPPGQQRPLLREVGALRGVFLTTVALRHAQDSFL